MKWIIQKIGHCAECPFYANTGAFTPGGAKSCCNHPEIVKEKGYNCFKRVIPYKVVKTEFGRFLAPKKLPKWCPLEDAIFTNKPV